MQDIIYSVNVVLPLFLVGALGYFLRVKGVVDMHFMEKGTSLCFSLLLPFMLFNEIYSADIVSGFSLKTFMYGVIGTLIIILLSILYAHFFIKDYDRKASIAHGIFRSNFIMMGVPLVENMYGKGSAIHTAAMLPVIISMFNIAAIVVFTVYAPKDKNTQKLSFSFLMKKIIRNPFIIAVVIAAVLKLGNITLPLFMGRTVEYIARASTTMSLLTIGGLFELSAAKKNLKYSLGTSFARLLVVPGIALSIAVAMGFRGLELASLLILFGSPSAVSSAAMAKSLGGDYKLAGEITMITAFFSAFSMFLFIFLFRRFSLL